MPIGAALPAAPTKEIGQMKTLTFLLAVPLLVSSVCAEEIWRWTDADGVVRYTNQREIAPASATPLETRIVIEADHMPGGEPAELIDVTPADVRERPHRHRGEDRRVREIYTRERRQFGCYAAGVMYSGGWSHPDDIAEVGNCLPYMLGPEAWLNAARAELAMREHGVDWKEVARMYREDSTPPLTGRLGTASETD
jgi:hypothetical protein